ncbi:MAG: hypothetical protein DRN99_03895 [Thermoproteota archaeon]|nr:MAG: hypothetical protein DRN99_03895 [Candidatus Korarchaeota archaeon]
MDSEPLVCLQLCAHAAKKLLTAVEPTAMHSTPTPPPLSSKQPRRRPGSLHRAVLQQAAYRRLFTLPSLPSAHFNPPGSSPGASFSCL